MFDGLWLNLLIFIAVPLSIGVWWFTNSFKTVEEGHVAVLEWFSKYSRVVSAGPYLLRPFERESHKLSIRNDEMSMPVAGIFTHGGMPLTVFLKYEMHLNPDVMSQSDLYCDLNQREEQQNRILTKILFKLVSKAPRVMRDKDEYKLDVNALFSPFFTHKEQIQEDLEKQASVELKKHGIEITQGSMLISKYQLPLDVTAAYGEALALNFKGDSKQRLIRQLRDAGANMSDIHLVQLINAISDNPGEFNNFFSSSGFQPDIRIQTDSASVKMPSADQTPPPSAGNSPQAANAAPSTNGASAQPSVYRPLNAEDMALLKSVE